MKFSVIIATYNRAEELGKTLESLMNLEVSGAWEVIIVDNNSRDNTRDVVVEKAKSFPVSLRYLMEKEQGRSAALNAGILAAQGDIIAVTDDDVRVDPLWLQNAEHALAQLHCDYLGGKALPIWSGPLPDWLPRREGKHGRRARLLRTAPRRRSCSGDGPRSDRGVRAGSGRSRRSRAPRRAPAGIALERGVALEVLAVLVERRRADGLDLPARERRLEDRGSVDRALGGACADEVVQLVDEQNDVAALGDLLHHLLQALLELTAVLRPGDERREVERVDLLALEDLRDLARGDARGEPFDDSGLADARLADEHRIVLLAA